MRCAATSRNARSPSSRPAGSCSDGRGFEEAEVDAAEIERLEPAMTNDPKDRHVLATAVAAGSELIVTFNLDDFPAETECFDLDGVYVRRDTPSLGRETTLRQWRPAP
jgi:hypothetical protein